MRKAVVVVEFYGEDVETMRWERSGTDAAGVFDSLGRAFEVAQRETGQDFHKALATFFGGALIRREDVQSVTDKM